MVTVLPVALPLYDSPPVIVTLLLSPMLKLASEIVTLLPVAFFSPDSARGSVVPPVMLSLVESPVGVSVPLMVTVLASAFPIPEPPQI